MRNAPLPKIVYPSSVLSPGSPSTLNFKIPPTKVSAFNLAPVRHDNTASSGVREVIYERTDQFLVFEMQWIYGLTAPTVYSGDVTAWQAFVASAMQGIPFDYYPNPAEQPTTFTTYFADEKTSEAQWKAAGGFTLKMKWYKYVNW